MAQRAFAKVNRVSTGPLGVSAFVSVDYWPIGGPYNDTPHEMEIQIADPDATAVQIMSEIRNGVADDCTANGVALSQNNVYTTQIG